MAERVHLDDPEFSLLVDAGLPGRRANEIRRAAEKALAEVAAQLEQRFPELTVVTARKANTAVPR